MHQIRAVIYAIITYDVNVPYYDLIDDIIEGEGYPTTNIDWSWLSTNSSLLTIRSGQQNSWPNAHADLNNVLSSIENAWIFLDADSDTDYDTDGCQDDSVEDLDDDNDGAADADDDCATIAADNGSIDFTALATDITGNPNGTYSETLNITVAPSI